MQWSWIARGRTEATMIAILAQTPAPPSAPGQTPDPSAGTAQISGVVKNAADDAPIGRARVSAGSDALPDARVTISRGDGTYVIPDLPAGSYTLTVTRTGYAPQTYGQARTI